MNDKVIELHPVPPIMGSSLDGWNKVQVEGRSIPKLWCRQFNDDLIEFLLDQRFSFTFPKNLAYIAAALAAQAMAIGEGYSNMHAQTKDQPFAPKLVEWKG